jgi:SAM-dependent methyltransferase
MITQHSALYKRFYSDPKHNQTTMFFDWVRESCTPQSRVLNLGAGPTTGYAVLNFKGDVAEIVGADIDPDVLTNTELDRAVVIQDGELPFPDAHFDVAFSDCVVEHVEKPAEFLAEVHRVLKPGASFYLRTPNSYHYVALISRVTPHWFHEKVANRVRGLDAEAHAPYPTFYRLNTANTVREAARRAGFGRTEIRMVEGHPSYLVFHSLPFLAGVAYERAVNGTEALAGIRANICGRLEK